MQTTEPEITHPALVLLTSHRKDCFDLCVWCLEKFTNIHRFEKIYILENEVDADHMESIISFSKKYDHVDVVHCSPRGLVPAVMQAQNILIKKHADAGVVKIDEDVFVTPYWLDHLLSAYNLHKDTEDVLMAGCISPVSITGRVCLHRFLRNYSPEIYNLAKNSKVYDDPAFHIALWDAVVSDGFMNKYKDSFLQKYFYTDNIIINCVLYSRKMIEKMLPFPCSRIDGSPVVDEYIVNSVLQGEHKYAVLPSAGLVHHYSHAACLDAMLQHLPVKKVREYMETVAGEGCGV